MHRYEKAILFVMLLIALAACNANPGASQGAAVPTDTATAAVDMAATGTAEWSAQATQAQATSFQATKAQATQDAQGTLDTQISATAAAATQKAETLNATRTAMANIKATKTAGPAATAEVQKAYFMKQIQQLKQEGVIGVDSGDYYHMNGWTRSEAQINYFFPDSLNYEANNFVFSTVMAWTSASMNSNWFSSGCGVLYGIRDEGNEAVLTYLGLDGYTHTLLGYKGGWPQIAFNKWGTPDLPTGMAKITIAMWDKRASIYVNEKLSSEAYIALYTPGDIGLTVVSGTNKDFGTTCVMQDINILILSE